MTAKIDRRKEGLKALASMISEMYCRFTAGDARCGPDDASVDIDTIPEDQVIRGYEPAESGSGFVYTETVSIDHFLRNKKRRNNKGKSTTQGDDNGTKRRK
ncbi:MAG: hypothetical protein JW712_02770 [Dehalococcoidales bacterium]|nr:hypothetical protein [Dehalococcoidales bacterium]